MWPEPSLVTATALSVRRYGTAPGRHAHPHFQVLVGLRGTLELEVAGRGHRIGPGQGLIVPPGETHDFQAQGRSDCLVLDSGHQGWTHCLSMQPPTARIGPLAHYLSQALAASQPLAALHGPSLLLEAWLPQPARPPARPRRAVDWQALADWLQPRMHQPLAVADLAERVHLSPGQFNARCREATGLSPQQWLRALRLARARLLRDGGLPVAEVARRCGYRSPSALTAALRRETANR